MGSRDYVVLALGRGVSDPLMLQVKESRSTRRSAARSSPRPTPVPATPRRSAYCGTGTRFDRALGRFAVAYADQTAKDHERFVHAIRAGRVPVRRGV